MERNAACTFPDFLEFLEETADVREFAARGASLKKPASNRRFLRRQRGRRYRQWPSKRLQCNNDIGENDTCNYRGRNNAFNQRTNLRYHFLNFFFKMATVVIDGPNCSRRAIVFVDDGSHRSFCCCCLVFLLCSTRIGGAT
jgi:hypothetical protein